MHNIIIHLPKEPEWTTPKELFDHVHQTRREVYERYKHKVADGTYGFLFWEELEPLILERYMNKYGRKLKREYPHVYKALDSKLYNSKMAIGLYAQHMYSQMDYGD